MTWTHRPQNQPSAPKNIFTKKFWTYLLMLQKSGKKPPVMYEILWNHGDILNDSTGFLARFRFSISMKSTSETFLKSSESSSEEKDNQLLYGGGFSPTHLKNMRSRQIGSFPQFSGWKQKIFELPTKPGLAWLTVFVWTCFFSSNKSRHFSRKVGR